MRRLMIVVAVGLLLAGCGTPEKSTSGQGLGPTNQANPDTAQVQVKNISSEFVNKGMEYLQKSEPIAAVKNFDEAIKRNPKDFRLYLVLSETYMRLHEYPRAADTLEAATLVAPDQGEISYLLAINYGLMGKRELAKKNAEKSIELFRQKKDEDNFLRAIALLQGLNEVEQPLATATDKPVTSKKK